MFWFVSSQLYTSGSEVDFVDQKRLTNAFRLINGLGSVELIGAVQLTNDEQVITSFSFVDDRIIDLQCDHHFPFPSSSGKSTSQICGGHEQWRIEAC